MKFFNLETVADWRTAMRLWSIRLGAFAASMVSFAVADPGTFSSILFAITGYMPAELRLPFAVAVGVLVFGLIYAFRVTKQKKLGVESETAE